MRGMRWHTVAEAAVAHGDSYVTHSNPSLSDVERRSIPVAYWQVLETSRFRARRFYRMIYADAELVDALTKLGRLRVVSYRDAI